MSRSWSGPEVTPMEVERAIISYLTAKPYVSRFKARDLADKTEIEATTHEIKHHLADLVSNGELERISYSSGASNYRPTDESQFRPAEMEAER